MPRQATSPHRIHRIADQIQRDLSELIPRELRDPRMGLVTIADVQLTPDYAHARVYFTVLGAEPDHVMAALNERAGYLHSLLFKRLRIHTVPTLHFVFDESTRKASDMNSLIAQAVASSAKDD
ncbi:MAG: 30S ribosome-binding factor RbfA [Betaproteobacteria bacterium]|jgi:ribosome-binding factor A|uniref:Ribosome-binding factor A n=1 Tax=Thiomonas delicata TaxID=364030 RepID=A0A238D8J7_THIDL|nr:MULTISPECIES: 30S ribosome-binding factor RbfA [Thiomonas]MDE2128336.1 30S ribosome-binding factor RbfA [Betaproteobacteria bacterium]OZB43579.1 MAG: ribosome-binding factor A [Thiomonas sp. 15-66-11]OZB63481.1 MAG: ribosome-binding factor A [Thiomonas sp. 13-66-29]SBP89643.1 Ribosome-binding factor A [Thiomonas delicata]